MECNTPLSKRLYKINSEQDVLEKYNIPLVAEQEILEIRKWLVPKEQSHFDREKKLDNKKPILQWNIILRSTIKKT